MASIPYLIRERGGMRVKDPQLEAPKDSPLALWAEPRGDDSSPGCEESGNDTAIAIAGPASAHEPMNP